MEKNKSDINAVEIQRGPLDVPDEIVLSFEIDKSKCCEIAFRQTKETFDHLQTLGHLNEKRLKLNEKIGHLTGKIVAQDNLLDWSSNNIMTFEMTKEQAFQIAARAMAAMAFRFEAQQNLRELIEEKEEKLRRLQIVGGVG